MHKVRRRISRLYSKVTPSALIPAPIRSRLGLKDPSEPPSLDSLEVLEKKGKYWNLSVDQYAICAEDASYSLSSLKEHSAPSSSSPYSIPSSRSLKTDSDPSGEPTSLSSSNLPPPFPITTLYITSCGHTYCYFCLSKRMIRASVGDDVYADEDGWECLRCEKKCEEC